MKRLVIICLLSVISVPLFSQCGFVGVYINTGNKAKVEDNGKGKYVNILTYFGRVSDAFYNPVYKHWKKIFIAEPCNFKRLYDT